MAKQSEANRRRELELGLNGIIDNRNDRIKTIEELADEYFSAYKLRHKSLSFAEYALGHLKRDAEIRGLQWGRVGLSKKFLIVGESKTEPGEGRTIPLNSDLVEALVEYSKWYTDKFGIMLPDWFVFPFGKPRPQDPTRPMVTLKSSWKNVREKAGVKGRWHDSRHTFITNLAESGSRRRDNSKHGRPCLRTDAAALFPYRNAGNAESRSRAHLQGPESSDRNRNAGTRRRVGVRTVGQRSYPK